MGRDIKLDFNVAGNYSTDSERVTRSDLLMLALTRQMIFNTLKPRLFSTCGDLVEILDTWDMFQLPVLLHSNKHVYAGVVHSDMHLLSTSMCIDLNNY